jgi:hypothetical protein
VTNDELELAKAVAEGTAEGLTRSLHEIVRNLAGPISKEVGEYFGEIAVAWRLKKRALRIASLGQALISASVVSKRPIPLKILLPLLNDASLEDDQELQDCWASLLASAADGDAVEITRAYVEILRELTSRDARLLQWIRHREPDLDANDPSRANNVDRSPEPTYVRPRAAREAVIAEFALSVEDFELTCSRLERLGVCDIGRFVFPTRMGSSGTGPRRYDSIQLRPLGLALVDACSRRLGVRPGDTMQSSESVLPNVSPPREDLGAD